MKINCSRCSSIWDQFHQGLGLVGFYHASPINHEEVVYANSDPQEWGKWCVVRFFCNQFHHHYKELSWYDDFYQRLSVYHYAGHYKEF